MNFTANIIYLRILFLDKFRHSSRGRKEDRSRATAEAAQEGRRANEEACVDFAQL